MKLHLYFQPFKMNFILFWTIGIVNSFPHRHKPRSLLREHKSSFSVGIPKNPQTVNMDLTVAKKKNADMELEFMKELEKLLNDTKKTSEKENCPDCKKLLEIENEDSFYEAKPAYHCDHWDAEKRVCWLDRNVGNTVTFVITLPPGADQKNLSRVVWKQVFHTLHDNEKRFFEIDPANPPWNIVVGSGGYELRLSPITEVDVDYNFFSAAVQSEELEKSVHFRIRAMPVDQGLVYPGASLMINMFSFVSLPEESMTFRWGLEKEPDNTLPSNMRLSMSGAVLTVSELRKEQEGIIVCSVYTNLGIFATQKRFLINGVNRGNNLLVFEATRPPYSPQTKHRRARREIVPTDEEEDEDESFYENKKPYEKDEDSLPKPLEDSSSYETNSDAAEQEKKEENVIKSDDLAEDIAPTKGPPSLLKHSKSGGKQENVEVIVLSELSTRTPLPKNHYKPTPLPIFVEPPSRFNQEIKDIDDILAVEVKISESEFVSRVSDRLSKMMSTCHRNSECSTYAECSKLERKKFGFCRCLPRYEGTGVFCWEVYKVKT